MIVVLVVMEIVFFLKCGFFLFGLGSDCACMLPF